MSSLDDLLNNSGLTSEQIGVIRSLISDWQLIADLTFSDLVLWVPQRGDSKSWPMGHRAVAQMRPTTGSTVIPYDVVGSTVAWSVRAHDELSGGFKAVALEVLNCQIAN